MVFLVRLKKIFFYFGFFVYSLSIDKVKCWKNCENIFVLSVGCVENGLVLIIMCFLELFVLGFFI